ncbi:MAG: hypothetical protein KKB62_01070 [Nanoarchaeota archaeon]|nr:hypothetical protein [Nanoarchaeota archaeon]
MKKETLEKLIQRTEEFMIKKNKKEHSSKGLIINYYEETSSIKSSKVLSIYLKKFFGENTLILRKEDDKITENYLSPMTIRNIEKVIYRK